MTSPAVDFNLPFFSCATQQAGQRKLAPLFPEHSSLL